MCCAGAYNVINRIFRCFITNNKIAIIKAYNSYARPHVEFSTTKWNPGIEVITYIGLNSNIKKVQKYFTRRLYYRCNISYENCENRLKNLKLISLEMRRKRFDIIMIYKLINGLVDIDYSSILNIKTNSSTRSNSQRIIIDNSRLDVQ